ncbi:MAG: hypothetical protein ACP5QI_00750, partial [Candidatus Bathyarchaeia archaeon]
MRISFKSIFKRRKVDDKGKEAVETSFEDAESTLKLHTMERELIRLILDVIGKAGEKGLLTRGEAERLTSKYRMELNKVEENIEKYTGILKLIELRSVRDSLYK